MSETVLDGLVAALREAAGHNSHESIPRVALLWPDPDEQWRPILDLLRPRLPLLALEPTYNPALLAGPASYLRCLVARTLPGVPDGEIPVIYLPGVSQDAVRVREECPRAVLPLVELQYRGGFFRQKSHSDWTVSAFLQTQLGVTVAADAATREAVLRALPVLAMEPIERLKKDAPLRADWFDRLHHPDPARAVLDWLSDPETFRTACGGGRWSAFRALVRSLYEVDPETDQAVSAARRLGERTGAWRSVWDRFAEHPDGWPGVPDRLRAGRPQTGLLDRLSAPDRWPQDNEVAEERLRTALLALTTEQPAAAREAVLKLEAQHGARRQTVWAKQGRAPLAAALKPLALIAAGTSTPLTGGLAALERAWTTDAWRVDLAVLDARACVDAPADEAAVRVAARAMYLPWLDAAATRFQKAVAAEGWPPPPPLSWGPGVVVLFSDGLRYDVAQRLAELLRAEHLEAGVATRLGALPGVTETGKPALMPIADQLRPAGGFDVAVLGSTSPKASADALRGAMGKAGIAVIAAEEIGDPSKAGWTEHGDVDHRGHDARWELGCELDGLLRKIAHRVQVLLDGGWAEVRIVTDHGWLVVPGELPKPPEVLPEHLTELRKGRCARLKPSSHTHDQTVPWHFDPGVRVAVAAGASCYEAGVGYEHGGLSPQECFLPVLTVRRGGGEPVNPLSIVQVRWKGLRVSVEIEGAPAGATLDLRAQPGDRAGWLVGEAPVGVAADGHATGLVEDDRRLGQAGVLVVLSPTGTVLAQRETTVGAR